MKYIQEATTTVLDLIEFAKSEHVKFDDIKAKEAFIDDLVCLRHYITGE